MGHFFPVTTIGVVATRSVNVFGMMAFVWAMTAQATPVPGSLRETRVQALVGAANALLENAGVSYAYGGNRLGSVDECGRCNECLALPANAAQRGAARLKACPSCQVCSLDCSHFVHLVYSVAGVTLPFMTTSEMIGMEPGLLRERYGWHSLDRDVGHVRAGDLVVYKGHVVMVEKALGKGRADIVHATSGRDLSGPGLGIQRERFVELAAFRGPVARVLRHQSLLTGDETLSVGPVYYIDDLQQLDTPVGDGGERSGVHPRLRKLK